MTDIEQIYNTIYQSTYCICAPARKIYLQFFKELINKYLTDTKNYHIYVSTTDNFLPLYKTEWPTHPRLIYVADSLVPTFPNNINIVYFYHQLGKPSKNEQLALVDYIDSTPLVKYVYVGSIGSLKIYVNVCVPHTFTIFLRGFSMQSIENFALQNVRKYMKMHAFSYIFQNGNLLSSVRTKLFRYYLHFEATKSKWGRIHTAGIIDYKRSRSFSRYYYSQQQRKKKATGNVTIHDYFLFHDNFLEESKIVKFNKKIIKKKKPVPKPIAINTTVTTTHQVIPETKIKYVFTGVRPNTNCLIMPNGSRENYNDVVNKYSNIIEV